MNTVQVQFMSIANALGTQTGAFSKVQLVHLRRIAPETKIFFMVNGWGLMGIKKQH